MINKNKYYLIVLFGAVTPPIIQLPLHSMIILFGILIVILNQPLHKIKINNKELFTIIFFIIVVTISGFSSGYTFNSFEGYRYYFLFLWTLSIWFILIKNYNFISFKIIRLLVLYSDLFILYYFIVEILYGNKYISTVESSYIYLIFWLSFLNSKFSRLNKDIFLMYFNCLLMLINFAVFSTSRGALIGLLLPLSSVSPLIFALSVVLLAAGLIFFPNDANYLQRINEGIYQLNSMEGTAADRYELWRRVIDDSYQNLLGRGAGSYRVLIEDMHIKISESFYVEILSAGGFLLLFIFLILMYVLGMKNFKNIKYLIPFYVSPLIIIATNPVGYHPITPLFIASLLFYSGRIRNEKN